MTSTAPANSRNLLKSCLSSCFARVFIVVFLVATLAVMFSPIFIDREQYRTLKELRIRTLKLMDRLSDR